MLANKPLSVFCAVVLSILAVYSKAEEHVGRQSRAAIANRNDLWTNGIIHYSFDDNISPRLRGLLEEAMTEWQDATCLLFVLRNKEEHYIKFESHPNREYCTCNSVGRRRGEQVIKLGFSCQSKGELLHTLGHVIGLWHEQARPDRDRYVRILRDNIETGQEMNFEKREVFSVDYQGRDYDFGSIMHLSARAYSKDGAETTKVLDKYKEVAKSVLGQRDQLSHGDIEQVNTLYNCPTRTVGPGVLNITILEAAGLTQSANPRVEVTAVDSNGHEVTLYTTEKKLGQDDVRNPQWEETLQFPIQAPMDWQFFRIRILAGIELNDVPLAMPVTVSIVPGEYREQRHCINANQNCKEYLDYGYEYIVDGDECDSNPCVNGDCTDLFVDYMCTCQRGYAGRNCDIDVSGDSCENNPCNAVGSYPDLCVDGFFDFTCSCRPGYGGKDCSVYTCDSQPCRNLQPCIPSDNDRRFNCACNPSYYGDLCEHNRCSPNPCHNEGTCNLVPTVEKGYACDCISVWNATTDCATHETRCLSIRIKSASNLPGTDGPFGGAIDPYVRLWIHAKNGVTQMVTTGVKNGRNPVWNFGFNINCEHGEHKWEKFTYEVWDDDGFLLFDDDKLESGEYHLTQWGQRFPACNVRVGRVLYDIYYYIRGGSGAWRSTCP